MRRSFILFRHERHLRAAHVGIPRPEAGLLIHGKRFAYGGGLYHWSHITDSTQGLVGFVVESLKDASPLPEWRAWWEAFANREVVDFWQAYLFLANPMPAQWREDCALLVGGWFYTDGSGEFAIGIPDMNGHAFEEGKPSKFWSEIRFELDRRSVATAGP